MVRLTAIAAAAVAITALLAVGAGFSVSFIMRMFFAHHTPWWWPLVVDGLIIVGWMTPFLPIGIAVYLVRTRGRQSAFNARFTSGRTMHARRRLQVFPLDLRSPDRSA